MAVKRGEPLRFSKFCNFPQRGEPLRHPTFQAWCVRLCVASKGVLLSFPMFCFVRASASKRKLRVQLTTYEQSSDNPVSLFSKF